MTRHGFRHLLPAIALVAVVAVPAGQTPDDRHLEIRKRMNYAPPEFQNVRFEKICEAPFVTIVALRDVAAGEELWVDYGPRYRYDFMEDAAVIAFFDGLRAQRAKEGRSAQLPTVAR